MLIDFRADWNGYFIWDLGYGTGTFIKLEETLQLKSDFIISFGESHMVVNIKYNRVQKTHEIFSEIELRFLDGPKIDEIFTFMDD